MFRLCLLALLLGACDGALIELVFPGAPRPARVTLQATDMDGSVPLAMDSFAPGPAPLQAVPVRVPLGTSGVVGLWAGLYDEAGGLVARGDLTRLELRGARRLQSVPVPLTRLDPAIHGPSAWHVYSAAPLLLPSSGQDVQGSPLWIELRGWGLHPTDQVLFDGAAALAQDYRDPGYLRAQMPPLSRPPGPLPLMLRRSRGQRLDLTALRSFDARAGLTAEPLLGVPTDQWLQDVAVADVDGDGRTDLLLALSRQGTQEGSVQVCLQGAAGLACQAPVVVPVHNPCALALLRRGMGGPVDVVLCGGERDNAVSVLRNDGRGRFTIGPSYPVAAVPLDLAIADLDSDGVQDVVVLNYAASGPSKISALFGAADGTLSDAVTLGPVGEQAQALAVADLDGDGRPDVAAVSVSERAVTMLRSAGGRLPFLAGATVSLAIKPCFLTAGDVDGDGRTDLVINAGSAVQVIRHGDPGPGLPDSTSALSAPLVRPSVCSVAYGHVCRQVALADLNGDERLDVVALADLPMRAQGALNQGQGEIRVDAALAPAVPASASAVVPGDWDGDGRIDLLVAFAPVLEQPGGVLLLRNTSR